MQSYKTQRTRSFRPRTLSVISVPLCFKSSPTEIAEHGYVLTPGRYIRAEEVEDDGVPFAENSRLLIGYKDTSQIAFFSN